MDFSVGDIVQMKKKHPCGSDSWEILRVGMDFRIKCCGCGHPPDGKNLKPDEAFGGKRG